MKYRKEMIEAMIDRGRLSARAMDRMVRDATHPTPTKTIVSMTLNMAAHFSGNHIFIGTVSPTLTLFETLTLLMRTGYITPLMSLTNA